MLPNPFNVYIHDTPADGLFARAGRSFSHGCVRIEDPMAFANYVLRDQPAWTRAAIEEAMHAGEEKHVKVANPIPVHILYFRRGPTIAEGSISGTMSTASTAGRPLSRSGEPHTRSHTDKI